MGLGKEDIKSKPANSNSSSDNTQSTDTGTSSSSGSSTSTDADDEERIETFYRVPYMAVIRDEDGELEFKHSPQHYPLEFSHTGDGVKESPPPEAAERSTWELQYMPEQIERYWMSKRTFQLVCSHVDEVLGYDLVELMQDNPEGALRAIIKAAKRRSFSDKTENRYQKEKFERDCGVCGEPIDTLEEELETVGNRVVHPDHSATELIDAGLVD